MLFWPEGLCFCTASWIERACHQQGRTAGRQRCGTKGALMEFNNSPAERLELDLWK